MNGEERLPFPRARPLAPVTKSACEILELWETPCARAQSLATVLVLDYRRIDTVLDGPLDYEHRFAEHEHEHEHEHEKDDPMIIAHPN